MHQIWLQKKNISDIQSKWGVCFKTDSHKSRIIMFLCSELLAVKYLIGINLCVKLNLRLQPRESYQLWKKKISSRIFHHSWSTSRFSLALQEWKYLSQLRGFTTCCLALEESLWHVKAARDFKRFSSLHTKTRQIFNR